MNENRHKTGFRGPSPDVGRATQFKPGQIANPHGRPTTKPITDGYRQFLSDPKELNKLIRKAVRLAQKGSAAHLREVTDRMEGPVERSIKFSGELDCNITLAEVEQELSDFFAARGNEWIAKRAATKNRKASAAKKVVEGTGGSK